MRLARAICGVLSIRWSLVAGRPLDEVLDFVAARILTMTPGERRQFDALMHLGERQKR